MPTWLAPAKKTRSPGSSWPIDTGEPIANCAYELCGSETPTCANAYMTRPEQSKPRGVVQLPAVLLDCGLEGGDLLDDARVLVRRRVDRLDAVEHVVEARRTEQNRERRIVLRRRVRGDEAGCKRLLRDLQVGARERELL